MDTLSLFWAAIYLIFSFFVLKREKAYGRISKYLILFCGLAVFFEILNAAVRLGWLAVFGDGLSRGQRVIGVYILSIVLLTVSYVFFNRKTRHKFLIYFSTIWAILLLVFTLSPMYSFGGLKNWSNIIVYGSSILGWCGVYLGLGYLIVTSYISTSKSLHKNRISLWGIAFLSIILGDVFLFVGQEALGSVLRITGIALFGYVIYFENLVNLDGVIQRIPLLLYKSLVALVLYAIVLVIQIPGVQVSGNESQPIQLLIKSVIIVVLVNPLLFIFNRFVDRSVPNITDSASKVAREYNLAISQIVDLPQLAKVALDEIVKIFQIKHAQFYLVDRSEQNGYFTVTPVLPTKENNSNKTEHGKFIITGSVVHQFNQLQKPLLQYELDFSPKYFSISEPEKRWLSEQEMDIFIPICTLDTWVGLFGLGAKKNKERFYTQEINLLSTLAEQTVIVLQNLRLISNLREVHNKLGEANDKLRVFEETKSAFIGVVSHELRTPLANIGFSLQILEMYGKEHLLAEQIEQMDLLAQSVKAARDMVDNLITYASFLNEKIRPSLMEFDFKEVMEGSLNGLINQAELKGLKFHLDFPGNASRVVGDQKLLVTAVQNLVLNAIKFTQTGSIWVTCWTVKDALCFDVQDTGVGIPSAQITHIWDAFTQPSSDPLKRGVEGLGLGLALVKMIIQTHGGFVWVESKPNTGSFFGFQIPLAGPKKPLDTERAKVLQLTSLGRSNNW